jgi:hypothetical protein
MKSPCEIKRTERMSISSLFVILLLFSFVAQIGCQGNRQPRGYDYNQHYKDDQERIKETRKRNKKTTSLLQHKGKSVKKPKPDLP